MDVFGNMVFLLDNFPQSSTQSCVFDCFNRTRAEKERLSLREYSVREVRLKGFGQFLPLETDTCGVGQSQSERVISVSLLLRFLFR